MQQQKGPNLTAVGIVLGGAAGTVLLALTGQIWWLGLVGPGLVLGSAMERSKQGPKGG